MSVAPDRFGLRLPACGLDVNGKGRGTPDNISLPSTYVLSAVPRVPAIYGKTTAKEDKVIGATNQ